MFDYSESWYSESGRSDEGLNVAIESSFFPWIPKWLQVNVVPALIPNVSFTFIDRQRVGRKSY